VPLPALTLIAFSLLATAVVVALGDHRANADSTVNNAARVFDACKRNGRTDEHCRNLVTKISNFEDCYRRCGTETGCFEACAVKTPTPVPWGLREGRPQLAAEFIGLTEADLIKRFGPPIETKRGSAPDGPYKMLVFSREKDAEIFFVITDADSVVSSGHFKGTAFNDPGYVSHEKACMDRFRGKRDLANKCLKEYRTPRKKPAPQSR
jgi:hypothetical protein